MFQLINRLVLIMGFSLGLILAACSIFALVFGSINHFPVSVIAVFQWAFLVIALLVYWATRYIENLDANMPY